MAGPYWASLTTAWPGLRSVSIRKLLTVLLIVIALTIPPQQSFSRAFNPGNDGGVVTLIELSTAVDGGAVLLVRRGINHAASLNASAVILKVNTYGGYLAAADSIVDTIRESGIKCYSWIPPGGKVVSAGALIALSCSKIFMSPGSLIGAAQPIPSDEKTLNYVVGRFRSLPQEVFSNETLVKVAEDFVTRNTVLSYEDAIRLGCF